MAPSAEFVLFDRVRVTSGEADRWRAGSLGTVMGFGLYHGASLTTEGRDRVAIVRFDNPVKHPPDYWIGWHVALSDLERVTDSVKEDT